MKIESLSLVLLTCFVVAGLEGARAETSNPNIVVILADDMGFGELKCLNPERGKIATPQLDAIAKSGMIFTDAHSGSSVCTPTRYGLMTGRYAWRTRLQTGVLKGGESLIAKDTLTIAKLLKSKGYHTAMIGKWHLGMMFDGIENNKKGAVKPGAVVTHGPIDFAGFDVFHGFHYARQMDLWIDNDKVTRNIEAVEMLPSLTAAAVDYIERRKGIDQPFFMYIPWNAPHSPVVPSEDWKGKSGINDHADFVMQTDDSYGQVVQALKANGFLQNTLILCSSDNGTSPSTSGLKQLKAAGHFPSANLRGMKADIWDGGHRVPFLVSWPGHVQPGSRCDDLVCLTDVIATVADLTGYELAESDAVDSFSFLSALTGTNHAPRTDVIHHSISGFFSIRQGKWKLIACPGSGGWSAPKIKEAVKEAESKGLPMVQLYDMQQDIGEQNNLAEAMPERVMRLRGLLETQIASGRTNPGPRQQNDVPIVIEKWKSE
ncbi:sulfatase family protein [Novipirellula artificiosorum]|uniref:Arylsulfatase n=1 Tax=Novipirellula artificiosorum TaxID=2528016 RepID=A0A5C6CV08_9BACT|nr:arylsulfatase [Novipirellula artificiosorum]TWU28823.1 Arylsulfatase [Novipirellula artificiosorum]